PVLPPAPSLPACVLGCSASPCLPPLSASWLSTTPCQCPSLVEAGEPLQEDGCSGGEVPTFLVAPSSMRVCRGEDVMFTCRVSGQPCPVLEWEKDGHFALFGTRPPDAGVYVCRARSGSREALAAAVLLVEPRRGREGPSANFS
uniref:Ig-like domain-containing protein n=1 Tax=Calidris pygmaea TaxID=425635 RepID=A0A8C3KCR2_9CHAR